MTYANLKPGWAKQIVEDAWFGEDWHGQQKIDIILLDSEQSYRVFLHGGDDILFTAAESATAEVQVVIGGGGGDRLYGNSGQEYLLGDGGADFLVGEGGNDYLFGGIGNDYLSGGDGRNQVWGGAGKDTYVLSGHDRVRDTQGEDIYLVEAGAVAKIRDDSTETDVMKFASTFDDTMIFMRQGKDLLITDDDGTEILIQNSFRKEETLIDVFTDVDGNTILFSRVNFVKGVELTGEDILSGGTVIGTNTFEL